MRKLKEESQSITLNPAETREILVSFILEQESGYHFTIIDGREIRPNFPSVLVQFLHKKQSIR